MITIKIRNPTEREMRTFTQIDITSDIPWYPEYMQQKYIITTDLCNDILDNAEKERK